MPNDVKAIVSGITLAVGISFAVWERWSGRPHLFWLVLALAAFAVAAMWVFPEAIVKKGVMAPRHSDADAT